MATYKIIRFKFCHEKEVIKTGLTLEEAQEHCNDPETRGEMTPNLPDSMWFDGYEEE